jgi:hypothetical protein
MLTRFVGDLHGKQDRFNALVYQHQDCELVALGDIGFGFHPVPEYPKRVGLFRGNHDNPAAARKHPNYMGDFGYHDGLFHLGGAYSIDWAIRKRWMADGERECWWPDEELSDAELMSAVELYRDTKPYIVATHEAPASIGNFLLISNGFRLEKVSSTQSRTAAALQLMFTTHQPMHWFFGHYHINWNYKVDGTMFHCLDELQVSQEFETNAELALASQLRMAYAADQYQQDAL